MSMVQNGLTGLFAAKRLLTGLAAIFALVLATPASAYKGTSFGLDATGDGGNLALIVAGNLGFGPYNYVHVGINTFDDQPTLQDNKAMQANIALAAAIHKAGYKVHITIRNKDRACLDPHDHTDGPDGTYGTISCPPISGADKAAYQQKLAYILDNIRPELVNIEIIAMASHADGRGYFWRLGKTGPADPEEASPEATMASYIQMLGLAVDVAHSKHAYAGGARHYKITNDGISASGHHLAYWEYLWLSGRHQAADDFAEAALYPDGAVESGTLRGDIPTSASPGIPILANHRGAKATLNKTDLVIPQYAATDIDMFNFHWFASPSGTDGFAGVDAEPAVIAWTRKVTGMSPMMTNVMGQRSADPAMAKRMMDTVIAMRLLTAFWYSHQSSHIGYSRAFALSDADGVLTPIGLEVKDYLKVCASPCYTPQPAVFVPRGPRN